MKNWPDVSKGMRHGEDRECFYCKQEIGTPHAFSCVKVGKRTLYEVLSDGKRVGTYAAEDSFFWDIHDCEFHKNGSSWCADNAVDYIQFLPGTEGVQEKLLEAICCCGMIEFKVISMDNSEIIFRGEDW